MSENRLQDKFDESGQLIEQMIKSQLDFFVMVTDIIDMTLSYIDRLDIPFSEEKLSVLRNLNLLREGFKEKARVIRTFIEKKKHHE